MLELSFIDLVLVVGGGAVLLGKRELPVVARYCGRGTGKLVALLNTVRDTMQNQSEKHGLKQFQDEVRKNLHQLNTVRSDLQFAGRSHPYQKFRPKTENEENLSISKPNSLKVNIPSLQESPPITSAHGSSNLSEGSVQNNSNNPETWGKNAGGISTHQSNATSKQTSLNTSHVDKSYLGKIALAEIVLNEKEKGGKSSTENQDPEKSGSDLVNNIILESLLNDQLDKLQSEQ